MERNIRNIAIIAHVDHGKTTLVDQILKTSKVFRENQNMGECVLDSNDLERERGITILSKNISIRYNGIKINVIDTPGHCDFGGQVERVLSMADGVLLLVDAAEGPMPQTRFVLSKALEIKLKPIVVINKVDRPDQRANKVLDLVFDLFVELDADDDQLDFPVLYGSGREGWMATSPDGSRGDGIIPLMETIIARVPAPKIVEGPVQMRVASLDYSEYVGRIGIGRVYRGTLDTKTPVALMKGIDSAPRQTPVKQLFTFEGLGRVEATQVECGELCAVVGVENVDIGDTITDLANPEGMAKIHIDEPTISMEFSVNNSPLYGKEGKFVSSRHIRERLFKEIERDVALRVEEVGGDSFEVSGRGVLHLSILIENMRREGYEMSIARPRPITKTVDGVLHEPIEILNVDTPDESTGKVIEQVGCRRGEMLRMDQHGGRTTLDFHIPTRGLIGLRSKILTATAGEAIVSHRFISYQPHKGEIAGRNNGVMVSMGGGKAVPFAIDGLQLRGIFFIEPGEETYEGMVCGEHCKDNDLIVNMQRAKQLTNMRAASSDRAMKIAPPRRMSLEEALEYIEEDELVEATPKNIRIRKRFLTELERKRNRFKADKAESED